MARYIGTKLQQKILDYCKGKKVTTDSWGRRNWHGNVASNLFYDLQEAGDYEGYITVQSKDLLRMLMFYAKALRGEQTSGVMPDIIREQNKRIRELEGNLTADGRDKQIENLKRQIRRHKEEYNWLLKDVERIAKRRRKK